MSLLFYLDADNEVILRPECVKLCPELRVLKQQELVFIILAYDYHGPYRLFPERDRERRAMEKAFGDNVPGLLDRETIKIAIHCYKGLQYDPKRELVASFERKIQDQLIVLQSENSATQIKKITDSILSLRSTVNDLNNEITQDVIKKGVIRGGGELNFLDELQSNWKNYEAVIAPRK